jgi:hypothetical protein
MGLVLKFIMCFLPVCFIIVCTIALSPAVCNDRASYVLSSVTGCAAHNVFAPDATDVCLGAMHAGLIQPAAGGTFSVQVVPVPVSVTASGTRSAAATLGGVEFQGCIANGMLSQIDPVKIIRTQFMPRSICILTYSFVENIKIIFCRHHVNRRVSVDALHDRVRVPDVHSVGQYEIRFVYRVLMRILS